MPRVPLASAALVLLALALPAQASAARAVPPLFYGANWDSQIARAPDSRREAEHARMASSGVETIRVAFEWAHAQPIEDGPFDHGRTDAVMRDAAAHGIDVLPVVILAPLWARQYKNVDHSPPADYKDYQRYLRELVDRYGPNGIFWTLNPLLDKRPIRFWQIWNEPELKYQWSIPAGVDWAPGYAKLVRYANRTIDAADPGARVVLGGLTNKSWRGLRHLYETGGIKGHFDVAAIHPYTQTADGVVELIRRFREVMAKNGDGGRRIFVTELGLPASQGKIDSDNPLQTTDTGMAQFLWRTYKALAPRAGQSVGAPRVYWYNWASRYCCESQFAYTGLLRYDAESDDVDKKPALTYYRRSARRDEGCAKDERAQCLP